MPSSGETPPRREGGGNWDLGKNGRAAGSERREGVGMTGVRGQGVAEEVDTVVVACLVRVLLCLGIDFRRGLGLSFVFLFYLLCLCFCLCFFFWTLIVMNAFMSRVACITEFHHPGGDTYGKNERWRSDSYIQ